MQSTNRQQIERSLDRIDKNTKEVYSPAVVVMAEGKNTYTCHGGHIFKVVNVVKGTIDWTKTASNVLHRDGSAPTGSDVIKMEIGVLMMNPFDELQIRCNTFTGGDTAGIFALYCTPGTKVTAS